MDSKKYKYVLDSQSHYYRSTDGTKKNMLEDTKGEAHYMEKYIKQSNKSLLTYKYYVHFVTSSET